MRISWTGTTWYPQFPAQSNLRTQSSRYLHRKDVPAEIEPAFEVLARRVMKGRAMAVQAYLSDTLSVGA